MLFMEPPCVTHATYGYEYQGFSTRRFLDSIDWRQSAYVASLERANHAFFDVRVWIRHAENLCESAHMRGLNKYERWLYENMQGIVGIFDDCPRYLPMSAYFWRTYRFECHATGMMFRLLHGVDVPDGPWKV
jgi:hypothetical protein